MRLRDLCADYHTFHRQSGTSGLQRKQFAPEHLPEMVMPPKKAAQLLTRNTVDYVPIAEAEGRIATTLMLVYPPGIGTVLPGERLDERAKPMLDYFKMFEASANLFPGFEAEIRRSLELLGALARGRRVVCKLGQHKQLLQSLAGGQRVTRAPHPSDGFVVQVEWRKAQGVESH